MQRQETACQKAFCQSVADHCMCPPPAHRLCAHLLGNLPWRRPAGPSWPLEADRKVTPHGSNCWHGESMDTVWKLRHQLSNQMCTLLPLLLRICPWLGRTSSMPSHDCEGVKAKPLASRGAHHCMRPIFHAAAGRRGQKRRTQSALTRCASLHVSDSWWLRRGQKRHTCAVTVFLGSVVAGNCLFDNLATGVLFMRSPTVIVTYHNPLFYDTYPVFNGQNMSSTSACIRRRDPCHVPSQTDPIIVHKRQGLRSKKQHHDISKMSKTRTSPMEWPLSENLNHLNNTPIFPHESSQRHREKST